MRAGRSEDDAGRAKKGTPDRRKVGISRSDSLTHQGQRARFAWSMLYTMLIPDSPTWDQAELAVILSRRARMQATPRMVIREIWSSESDEATTMRIFSQEFVSHLSAAALARARRGSRAGGAVAARSARGMRGNHRGSSWRTRSPRGCEVSSSSVERRATIRLRAAPLQTAGPMGPAERTRGDRRTTSPPCRSSSASARTSVERRRKAVQRDAGVLRRYRAGSHQPADT